MKWMLSCALALTVGCGGSAAPPKPVTVGPGAPVEGSQELGSGADLSPVAAPAELFLVGRLQNPGKLIDTVAGWSKVPIDWRKLLAKEEPGIERVVQLDAPIEFLAALDPNAKGQMPEPIAVFSVGLTSLEAAVELARDKGQDVRQVRAGVFRTADGDCALAASVGKAPARLVCGDRSEDVDALLPYATRGLPNERLAASDFHLELRAEPIRRRHGRDLKQLKLLAPFAVRDLSLDNARFDRALKDAAHGLADEIINISEDLDTISMDAWLRGDAVEATASVKLRDGQSWSAQTLADLGKRASAPTEAFWKLPADASSASFTSGNDPKRYESIRRTLAELLDGWLEHERVPRRVRDDLVDLVEEAFKTDSASAYASGVLPSTGTASSDAELEREVVRNTVGWHILHLNDKADRYKKYFGNAARSYNDAQLRKVLQQRLDINPKELPKLTTRAARGLAGSAVYELSVPMSVFKSEWAPPPAPGARPKPPAPAKPVSFVLIVVPQGNATWLGFSVDEKVLTDKLAVAMKGSADKTLASREGLTSLKNASAVSGGFFTVASFMGSMKSYMLRARGGGDSLLASMPHKGATPMPQLLSIKSQGKGLIADFQIRVPRAVFEDIGAAIPAMSGAMMGSLGGPSGVMVPPPAPPQVPTSRP